MKCIYVHVHVHLVGKQSSLILSLSCTAAGDGQGPKKETMYVTFIFKCVLFYIFIVLLQ